MCWEVRYTEGFGDEGYPTRPSETQNQIKLVNSLGFIDLKLNELICLHGVVVVAAAVILWFIRLSGSTNFYWQSNSFSSSGDGNVDGKTNTRYRE